MLLFGQNQFGRRNTAMFFRNKSLLKFQVDKSRQEKDLDTLFIIAGCPGAGKSTIVRSAYQLDIPLFGEEFHQQFLSTCRSPGFVEYDSYSDAIQYGSIFQARHLKNLRREPSPPNCLLLHIDLKGVIEFLGYRSARKKLKNQIKKSTILPVPQLQMIDPMICDLMISGYLSNPMFKRFNKVLINTVHTSFKNNSRQLYARNSRQEVPGKPSKHKNLGFSKVNLARRFHKEAYNAWHRNLYKLHPVRVDSTHVDLSGNLVVNNQSICDNWKSKVLSSNN